MTLELKTYASRLHRAFVSLAEDALTKGKLERFYFLSHVCHAISSYTLGTTPITASATDLAEKQNTKNPNQNA